MNITVILENAPELELDRVIVNVPASADPDEAANLAIHEAIAGWTLSPGDTIRIGQ